MNDRMSALLCIGALLLSQIGFTPTLPPAFAETVPLTPSQVIDASNYTTTGDLQIDNGQHVVIDFSNAPNGLQISGNLINNGNLFAVSTNSQNKSANFSAINITNTVGSLFTTNLPSGGISGFANAISNLNLSLTASNNVINQGIISSAGNLNVTAGNAVINALPTGVSGPAPVMQALNNLNLFSGAGFLNQGIMSSVTADINIATIANNLVFNNIGGQLQAYNAVSFRDILYAGSGNVHLFGGELLAQQLNVFSGTGFADVNMSNISALLNISADRTLVQTNNSQLSVGSLAVFDPSIYNTGGDIIINSPLDFPGEHLAIVAAGSVIADKGASIINTGSGGKAGNILIAAGAAITGISGNSSPTHDPEQDPPGGIYTFYPDGEGRQLSYNSSAFTITGGNGTPSVINLGNTLINSSGTDSGNIIMVSFGGGIAALGTLNAEAAGGKAGYVQILAKGPIEVGNINASGGKAGTGSVSIIAATQPYAFAPDSKPNFYTQNVIVNNGEITFGGFSQSNTSTGTNTDYRAAAISVGNIASSGGKIEIRNAGGDITVGSINGATAETVTNSSFVRINNFSNFQVFQPPSDIITGDIISGAIDVFSSRELKAGNVVSLGNYVSLAATPVGDFSVGGGSGASSVASVTLSGPTHTDVFQTGIFLTNNGTGWLRVNQDLTAGSTSESVKPWIYLYSYKHISLGNVTSVGGDIGIEGQTIQFRPGSTVDASGPISGGYLGLYGSTVEATGLTLKVDGGTLYGGTIDVLNNGPLESDYSFSGGSITMSANAPESNGDIFIYSPAGFAFDGTTISAAANGPNGIVFVLQEGTSPLEVGATSGFTSLHSNGTISGNGVGDGGTVLVISGGDLTVNSASISAAAGSDGGNGGVVDLEAGSSGIGTLKVNGDIHVDGKGTEGNGGTVYLIAPTLEIGNVLQRITADGSGAGNGGLVYLEAQDQDGSLTIGSNVRLSANGGSVGSSGGNGGQIQIGSAKDLTVRPASLDVRVLGQNGDGGQIKLYSGYLGTSFEFNGTEFVEVVNHAESGTLSLENGGIRADSAGTGNGGSVVVQGPTVNLNAGIGTLTVAARGIGDGNGGSVSIKSVGEGQALILGDTDSVVNLNANGGINGTAGDGGRVEIESAADITELAGGSISATAAGLSGKGGEVSIKGTGTVQVLDNVTVLGGTASGDGGKITIENDGSLTEIVGPLQADARGSGNGGEISIKTLEEGAVISIHDGANGSQITSRGGGIAGNGGLAKIESGGSIVAQGVVTNTSAIGSGNGGLINLSSSGQINYGDSLRADGAGVGNGGKVTVQSLFSDVILDSTSAYSVSVDSGESAGTGGFVTVSGQGNLTITKSVSGNGATGGGSILMTAQNIELGTSGSNSTLRADSLVEGNGGTVNMVAKNSFELHYSAVSSNARGVGNAGELNLIAESGNFNSTSVLYASQLGSQGNGGKIEVLASNGTVFVEGVRAEAKGDGLAGSIFIDPDDIFIGIEGIYATGSKGHGRVKLVSNSGSITVLGPIRAFADDLGGEGGLVYLEAAKNILTGPINAAGLNGAGGAVVIRSNQHSLGSSSFVVGTPIDNGVFGSINISGTKRAGESLPTADFSTGFVMIEDLGSGGIVLSDSSNLIVKTTGDHNHSAIVLSAPNAQITLNGSLSADASSTFNAGTVVLDAKDIVLGPNATVTANASGLAAFGGNVTIAAERIIGNQFTQNTISANGNRNNIFRQGSIEIFSRGMLDISTLAFQGDPQFFGVNVEVEVIGTNGSINFEVPGGLNIEAIGPSSGGNIAIAADGVIFAGQTNVSVRSRYSNVDSNGGSIGISNIVGMTDHLSLVASGGGTGTAGKILLGSITGLEFGATGKNIGIQARGGRANQDLTPNVTVLAAGDIIIDGEGIDLTTSNGNGGAGFRAFSSAGALRLSNLLSVNSSDGQGGNISLEGISIDLPVDARLEATGKTAGGAVQITLHNSAANTFAGNIDSSGELSGLLEVNAEGPIDLSGSRFISKGSGIGGIQISAPTIAQSTGSRTGFLSANIVTLKTNAGDAGSAENRIYTRADKLNAILSGQNSAFVYQLGDIELAQIDVNGGTFDLRTNQLDSSIGNITGTISAKNVVLNSVVGNIGNSSSPLSIHADQVTFQARNGENQTVALSLHPRTPDPNSPPGIRKVAVLNSYSSGSISMHVHDGLLYAQGTITAHNGLLRATADNGISIVSNVTPQTTLQASNGSILLATGGNIILGEGTRLIANQGSVTLFVGDAQLPSDNSFPAGDYPSLRVRTFNSGGVFMDPGVLTATGSLNRITADGGIVEFGHNEGYTVTLSGDVVIRSTFTPISMSRFPQISSLEEYRTKNCIMIFSALQASIGEGAELRVENGECFLSALEEMVLIHNHGRLVLPKGFVGLVDCSRNSIKVKNLSVRSAIIIIDEQTSLIEPGQLVCLSSRNFSLDKKQAVRRISATNFPNNQSLSVAEFSIPSELANNGILQALRSSKSPDHCRTITKIMKVAASLSLVTSSHGPFQSSN